MAAVGSGACELRIRDESGAYRVDIAIAKNRYKQIVKENSA
jgi:phage-related protein